MGDFDLCLALFCLAGPSLGDCLLAGWESSEGCRKAGEVLVVARRWWADLAEGRAGGPPRYGEPGGGSGA